MQWLKNTWGWIVAGLGFIAVILFQRNARKLAESKLLLNSAELQDALLKAKLAGNLEEIKRLEEKEQLIKNRKPVELTHEEIVDFYKSLK